MLKHKVTQKRNLLYFYINLNSRGAHVKEMGVVGQKTHGEGPIF